MLLGLGVALDSPYVSSCGYPVLVRCAWASTPTVEPRQPATLPPSLTWYLEDRYIEPLLRQSCACPMSLLPRTKYAARMNYLGAMASDCLIVWGEAARGDREGGGVRPAVCPVLHNPATTISLESPFRHRLFSSNYLPTDLFFILSSIELVYSYLYFSQLLLFAGSVSIPPHPILHECPYLRHRVSGATHLPRHGSARLHLWSNILRIPGRTDLVSLLASSPSTARQQPTASNRQPPTANHQPPAPPLITNLPQPLLHQVQLVPLVSFRRILALSRASRGYRLPLPLPLPPLPPAVPTSLVRTALSLGTRK